MFVLAGVGALVDQNVAEAYNALVGERRVAVLVGVERYADGVRVALTVARSAIIVHLHNHDAARCTPCWTE